MGDYFADIHVHSTLKSFNSGYPSPRHTIWDDVTHNLGKTAPARLIYNSSREVAKYSQSNFYELAKGRVRVATVSLYPLEKGFLEMRSLSKAVTRLQARKEMVEAITGYAYSSVEHILKHNDYFEELQSEYKYIRDHQGDSPDGNYAYRIVNNFEELTQTIKSDKRTLAIVLSIEGAHVFYNEKMLSGKLSPQEMKKELMQNIIAVKNWGTPPFTINLSHHFYNGLCGHAKSLAGIMGSGILNQNKGLESNLTGLGIKCLKELLSPNNGKRILVDIKHMSLSGRKELYNWIRSYNYLSKNDKIPIVCSHTGINGYKTMSSSLLRPDNNQKNNRMYFNRWSINLSDEEIRIIHESGGIIGLMLDKYKLGGGLFFKSLKLLKDEQQLRDAYCSIFMDNALQIVSAVGNKSGWDCIALGSDYDGAISHVDFYDKCSTMPQLSNDLISFLERTRHGRSLWHGYKPNEIVDKILRKNVMDFYQQHFI
ncbi:MAG: membrane dipeptidase [Candidatus Competibacteraceae bacterium]|nr:membrane dipeptidase [Candidatus Competibacteraceae bacterium]